MELRKLKKLNKLIMHLEKNRINDDCIDILFEDLLKVKKLKKLELNMSVNLIGDIGGYKILRIK